MTEAFAGITTDAFEAAAREFFASAIHPTLGLPYTEVAYRPMLELIQLLGAHDFRVYICSAGGRDFVRAVCEQVYDLPRDRVIGSATTLEYRDGELYRTAGVERPSTTDLASSSTSDAHRVQTSARRRQRRRGRRHA